MSDAQINYNNMMKHHEATMMLRFIGEPKLLHQWFWWDSTHNGGYWGVVPFGDDTPPSSESE